MTSYTSSVSLEDERHQTLRDAIVKLCLELRPMDGPPAVIRTEPAPGFKALVDEPLSKKHRITIELQLSLRVVWSMYGHVIAEISRMDRFSKLWGFEFSP